MSGERVPEDTSRQYARQITLAQEEERRRIARDLHDDVSSSILLLIQQLEALEERQQSSAPELAGELRQVRDRAETALEALRRISQGLRPRILDDFGLAAAIEWLADEFRNETGMTVEVSVSGMDREPAPEAQTGLFRIAQEALNNVRKHAGASRVQVLLAADCTGTKLDVTDNGRGFIPGSTGKSGSGLAGMKERAALLDGELEIRSEPGRGTKVSAIIPVARPHT